MLLNYSCSEWSTICLSVYMSNSLRFNGLGKPVHQNVSILDFIWRMDMLVTTGAIRRAKLQSNRRHTNCVYIFSTSQVKWLSPNLVHMIIVMPLRSGNDFGSKMSAVKVTELESVLHCSHAFIRIH